MIFYLSDTGNTRWAAEKIAERTGDELVFIPDLLHNSQGRPAQPLVFNNIADGERIGFCFPVHGWRPPKIVREFISRLKANARGHYVYALCTAGDDIGETIDILGSDLQKQGIHLDAAFTLIMPESYMGLPFFNVDKPEKEKEKKEKAAADLKAYMEAIANRRSEWHLVPGRWPRINSRFLGGFFTRFLLTDKPFHVESRKCVKCGICADICPVHNIIGGLGHEPAWKHDGSCLACFACYHHCPHHAIEYGHVTQGKGQYFFKKRQ